MNNNEFSNQFDVLYNNIMSNEAPGLNEYEKSVFLTKAQDEIVKNHFNPKSNAKTEGFDDTSKRQADFSMLMKTFSTNQYLSGSRYTDYPLLDPRSIRYKLPDDVFIIVNEALTIGKPIVENCIAFWYFDDDRSMPYGILKYNPDLIDVFNKNYVAKDHPLPSNDPYYDLCNGYRNIEYYYWKERINYHSGIPYHCTKEFRGTNPKNATIRYNANNIINKTNQALDYTDDSVKITYNTPSHKTYTDLLNNLELLETVYKEKEVQNAAVVTAIEEDYYDSGIIHITAENDGVLTPRKTRIRVDVTTNGHGFIVGASSNSFAWTTITPPNRYHADYSPSSSGRGVVMFLSDADGIHGIEKNATGAVTSFYIECNSQNTYNTQDDFYFYWRPYNDSTTEFEELQKLPVYITFKGFPNNFAEIKDGIQYINCYTISHTKQSFTPDNDELIIEIGGIHKKENKGGVYGISSNGFDLFDIIPYEMFPGIEQNETNSSYVPDASTGLVDIEGIITATTPDSDNIIHFKDPLNQPITFNNPLFTTPSNVSRLRLKAKLKEGVNITNGTRELVVYWKHGDGTISKVKSNNPIVFEDFEPAEDGITSIIYTNAVTGGLNYFTPDNQSFLIHVECSGGGSLTRIECSDNFKYFDIEVHNNTNNISITEPSHGEVTFVDSSDNPYAFTNPNPNSTTFAVEFKVTCKPLAIAEDEATYSDLSFTWLTENSEYKTFRTKGIAYDGFEDYHDDSNSSGGVNDTPDSNVENAVVELVLSNGLDTYVFDDTVVNTTSIPLSIPLRITGLTPDLRNDPKNKKYGTLTATIKGNTGLTLLSNTFNVTPESFDIITDDASSSNSSIIQKTFRLTFTPLKPGLSTDQIIFTFNPTNVKGGVTIKNSTIKCKLQGISKLAESDIPDTIDPNTNTGTGSQDENQGGPTGNTDPNSTTDLTDDVFPNPDDNPTSTDALTGSWLRDCDLTIIYGMQSNPNGSDAIIIRKETDPQYFYGGFRTVVPISHVDYRRLMSKPYKEPLKWQAWRLMTNTADNSADEVNRSIVEIVTTSKDRHNIGRLNYEIRYIKRPRPIILANFSNAYGENITIQNKDGSESEYSNNGNNESWEPCELDPILHEEILQRAVELAKVAWTGDANSNIQTGVRSE